MTIAGSDRGGGAGIQADLKTFAALGVFGTSVITCLTAQNPAGVRGIQATPPRMVALQAETVAAYFRLAAAKTGMLYSAAIIEAVAQCLRRLRIPWLVVDPVMIATSGARLLRRNAEQALCERLLPLARVITPNLPEAEVLSGITIRDRESMKEAGHIIAERARTNTLIKGGHFGERADDLLVKTDGSEVWFLSERIDNPNTHGTGCTLSSAIACGLAAGASVEESVRAAKDYITDALKSGLDLGRGSGPLDHCCRLRKQVAK